MTDDGLSAVGALVEHLEDGVAVFEASGRLLEVNPALARLVGRSPDALVGQSVTALHPLEAIGTLLEGTRAVKADGSARLTLAVLRRSGESLSTELTLRGFRLDGRPVILGVYRDATLDRRAEAAEADARQRSADALKTRTRFVAHVSHELRTPITAVLGYAELLAPTVDGRAREWCDRIRTNGRRLQTLVDDLLDLTASTAGELRVDARRVDLRQVLDDVVELLAVTSGRGASAATVDLGADVPLSVVVDPDRATQILLNLANDALGGDAGVTVDVRSETREGRLVVCAHIRGTGTTRTPDALRTLLADPGVAEASTPSSAGLQVATMLAARLGGGIDVRSDTPRSAHFALWLPLDALDPRYAPTPQPVQRRAEAALVGRRVLIVEDSEDNRRILAYHFERAGAAVTLAEDGQLGVEAVQHARAEGRAPDLIVMDVRMPRLDGYGATRAIRALGSAMPVVVLTAHAFPEAEVQAFDAGADAFLPKPIDAPRLIGLCRELIDTRAAHTGLAPAVPDEPLPFAPAEVNETMLADPGLWPLVASYADHLERYAEGLTAAFEADDAEEARSHLHRLKGSAGSYGFTGLGRLADELGAELRAGSAPAGLRDRYAGVQEAIDQARERCATIAAALA